MRCVVLSRLADPYNNHGGTPMRVEPSVSPHLLVELLQAAWCKISALHDDHKLEIAHLPNQPEVSYYRKCHDPHHVYVAKRGNRKDMNCLSCGSSVLSVRVVHPIHHALFPLAGSGQCHNEDAPYCPDCETAPNPNGSIINS